MRPTRKAMKTSELGPEWLDALGERVPNEETLAALKEAEAMGASDKSERAVVNGAAKASPPEASIPCAVWLSQDDAEVEAWGAMRVGPLGDDKPFLDELRRRGVWLARFDSTGNEAIADGSQTGRETGSESGGAEGNRPRSYAQGFQAALTEIKSLIIDMEGEALLDATMGREGMEKDFEYRGAIGEGKDGQET